MYIEYRKYSCKKNNNRYGTTFFERHGNEKYGTTETEMFPKEFWMQFSIKFLVFVVVFFLSHYYA